MYVLAIDTSSRPLSVAVVTEHEVLSEITINKKMTHSQTLMPAIDAVLKNSGVTIQDIDRFAVAQGPGSYTGIRIGVTTAKTLAWTLNKPLVGLSSLALLASNVTQTPKLLVPIMDARRNNVFAGAYQWRMKSERHFLNVLKDRHLSLPQLLAEVKILQLPTVFIGEVTPFKEEIFETLGQQAEFTTAFNNLPHSANLGQLALQTAPVADVAHFTPNYLRMTEAEANWLKDHEGEGHDPYVQEV
ncbi:tRNA (adenosine(37)-N6)-threonylcarbamoyltransferase complex dimerization subunit type 1 TsaB [Agrilactobacillus yilanensis]|uniref:tRNA (Adenosine(37)-N6)-threonylcarbamoyltransferase complex dimerization subunit type 1 TsaB n=1 Tax=Agrilactobacillus yilanensis TaxID=2485997 RepID=A0ABW4J7P6_9LACO|nr:tRNA (adenosine(37)-N6)-threonylcarbamoyltransferase complex dimerization subunit type 1 TsaB [Agrilactobacillus yilanensis]